MTRHYFGQAPQVTEFRFVSRSPEQTREIAAEFARFLLPGDVIACMGDLGSGKTTFIGGLCQGLQVQDRPSSPTFTIINEYAGKTMPVFHFDFYRLESETEVMDLGLEDYLERGGICVIEWADKFIGQLPAKRYDLFMKADFENQAESWREIEIKKR